MVRGVKEGDILRHVTMSLVLVRRVRRAKGQRVRIDYITGTAHDRNYWYEALPRYFTRPTPAELVAARLLGKLPGNIS